MDSYARYSGASTPTKGRGMESEQVGDRVMVRLLIGPDREDGASVLLSAHDAEAFATELLANATAAKEQRDRGYRLTCPDAGYCHHQCKARCVRVQTYKPMTGFTGDNQWPAAVVELHREPPFSEGSLVTEITELRAGGALAPALIEAVRAFDISASPEASRDH
jgi:hypothetical protein